MKWIKNLPQELVLARKRRRAEGEEPRFLTARSGEDGEVRRQEEKIFYLGFTLYCQCQ